MPTNVTPQYQKAEQKYTEARTPVEKLKALQEMLRLVPKHKSSEGLQKEIKQKISKYKGVLEKEKQQKKGAHSLSIKKEGAAQVCIVGLTNSGKSTLLKKLTNANPKIDSYEFTTRKPEVGTMDYHGIKIQVIEVPAIVKNYIGTDMGATYLAIIRQADLLVITVRNEHDFDLIKKELKDNDIKKNYILYKRQKNIEEEIWTCLKLIKVFTKQPRKKPVYPPVSLGQSSSVKDLAEKVHKDFIKQFKFARIWGKSAKFPGQTVGLNHKLKDDDIVELHMR